MSSMSIKSIDKIAVIGAGWLGGQVSDYLNSLGLDVLRTNTTSKSTDNHSKVLRFPTDDYSSVSEASTFIVNIPPSKIEEKDFQDFRNFFKDKRFIFISSTSVFDKSQGEVNEQTAPKPSSERGKKNLRLEEIFKDDCIIRCGGLIGPNRHPVKSLVNKSIEGGHYINLIHSEDVIQIIKLSLEKNYKGIIHASFPSSMTKKEYYQKYAQKYDLVSPKFLHSENCGLKINSVVLEDWNYKYRNDLF